MPSEDATQVDPTGPTADVPVQADTISTRVPSGEFVLDELDLTGVSPPAGIVDLLMGEVGLEEQPKTQKYSVQDEIGRGGMGKILRVRDTDLNRQVAMKVLLGEDGKLPSVRRFVEEAQVTGQLEHPSVLPVHDFGVGPGGELFFTMQYVPGNTTLSTVIQRLNDCEPAAHDEYTWERRVQIVQQVCHALHYAHTRGVVHRDIKPDNILLGSCGEVYLVDWGVARLTGDVETGPGDAMPVETLTPQEGGKTQQGAWIGTPLYMAPEQIMGMNEEIGPQTDTYALSAVLYEFLTLHHYISAKTSLMRELVGHIVQTKPKDAESYYGPMNGRVPRHLSRICRKGLSKRKGDRYQTAEELRLALQHWVEGRAPIVCPGTFLQHWLGRWSAWIDRHPTAVPAFCLTLIALILFAAGVGVALGTKALAGQ